MHKIVSLYPQYKLSKDRRQQDIPVAIDRRSGNDRRSQNRVLLDTRLTRDIYDVKSKISKLEAMAPRLFEQNVTTQAPTFSSMNNLTQDTLVKSAKPDLAAIARQEAALQERASNSFLLGTLAIVMAGAISIPFMGSAGVIVAIGTTLYMGARLLKTLIAKEIKDEKKEK